MSWARGGHSSHSRNRCSWAGGALSGQSHRVRERSPGRVRRRPTSRGEHHRRVTPTRCQPPEFASAHHQQRRISGCRLRVSSSDAGGRGLSSSASSCASSPSSPPSPVSVSVSASGMAASPVRSALSPTGSAPSASHHTSRCRTRRCHHHQASTPCKTPPVVSMAMTAEWMFKGGIMPQKAQCSASKGRASWVRQAHQASRPEGPARRANSHVISTRLHASSIRRRIA